MSESLSELQKKKKTRFPISRIKKVIQSNEDVGKTTLTVPVVLSKSIELFMEDILKKLLIKAQKNKSNRINIQYFNDLIKEEDNLYSFIKPEAKEEE